VVQNDEERDSGTESDGEAEDQQNSKYFHFHCSDLAPQYPLSITFKGDRPINQYTTTCAKMKKLFWSQIIEMSCLFSYLSAWVIFINHKFIFQI